MKIPHFFKCRHALGSSEGVFKQSWPQVHSVCRSRERPGICISKSLGDADAAGLGTTLWDPLMQVL